MVVPSMNPSKVRIGSIEEEDLVVHDIQNAGDDVFYNQFCLDLLKIFGTDRLEGFTQSTFGDTMR